MKKEGIVIDMNRADGGGRMTEEEMGRDIGRD